jgi:thiol-disulfide isomerase/thioredoxin
VAFFLALRKHWAMQLPKRCLAAIACLLLLPSLQATADERITYITAPELEQLLKAQRGKVILVNFWATWCAPCLKEIPALMELADEYPDHGFELVAVALDDPDMGDAQIRNFMDRFFPGFTTYARLDYEMSTPVAVIDPVWNEILPTSYALNRDGRVAAKIQGGKSKDEFAAAIAPLLED